MARVRVFDPRLSAGDYITKQLDRNPDASLARGFHESGKLNWSDCRLTIANSVLRAVKRQIEDPAHGDRARSARADVHTSHLKQRFLPRVLRSPEGEGGRGLDAQARGSAPRPRLREGRLKGELCIIPATTPNPAPRHDLLERRCQNDLHDPYSAAIPSAVAYCGGQNSTGRSPLLVRNSFIYSIAS